ncbi:bola-like protein [Dichomitus squalens LYAD-421 SS1]|uniref:bola-like protein n=1 Tax=Dichomitus squalens (strain LYAD-421) TaxID=732165 RepID=UPI0004412A82|nr:bola-like protein [Dichomitus squalens LYAD-421 SS1]EJF63025.1 bola-like protein [Dichomitus squalens LYAD-421 SS1]
MLSLVLTRRIARPSLANFAFSFARWYSAAQANFSTDSERLIHQKLTEKFKPTELHVEDVSGGCGTFYNIIIASEEFKGLPLVKQQRLVNQTLKEEIKGIHGLQASRKLFICSVA